MKRKIKTLAKIKEDFAIEEAKENGVSSLVNFMRVVKNQGITESDIIKSFAILVDDEDFDSEVRKDLLKYLKSLSEFQKDVRVLSKYPYFSTQKNDQLVQK